MIHPSIQFQRELGLWISQLSQNIEDLQTEITLTFIIHIVRQLQVSFKPLSYKFYHDQIEINP